MRCHPERQWRGINPPNYHRPVSPVKQTNNVEALITEEDHEIAASLLMLANGAAASESECDTNYQPGVQENYACGCKLPVRMLKLQEGFWFTPCIGGAQG